MSKKEPTKFTMAKTRPNDWSATKLTLSDKMLKLAEYKWAREGGSQSLRVSLLDTMCQADTSLIIYLLPHELAWRSKAQATLQTQRLFFLTATRFSPQQNAQITEWNPKQKGPPDNLSCLSVYDTLRIANNDTISPLNASSSSIAHAV
jgi:hypothetical protein